MNGDVAQLVLQAVVDRWRQGERVIASEDIYAQLVRSGAQLPDGALAEACLHLAAQGLIRAPGMVTSVNQHQHGALLITWADPDLVGGDAAATPPA